MFEKLKRLGSDTAIYGVSTVLGRFLTFLLTPIYANILPPSDVGIIATIYAYIAFLNVIYNYGMDSAYLRYVSTLELGNRKQTFTVPFISVAVSSLIFSTLVIWESQTIAIVIGMSGAADIIQYAGAILLLDVIALVPFAELRISGKAKQFAAIKLSGIGVNVVCNIVLLVGWEMGVQGVFVSGVISSGFTLLLLLPTIGRNLGFGWSPRLYRALLAFGLPSVPAGLGGMMIQVIDRPILEALTDKATVGIYQANYRLGIFMMLVVSMFDFAWRPFFMTHARDPDAKPLFARVLTYFVLLMTGVLIVLSFFLEEVVKLPLFWGYSVLPEPYWDGLTIVPVVLLAYLFLGISNVVVAGIYIEKQTSRLPLITFAGATVNVAGNFLLIPLWGIMGAAVATLLSYAVMAVSAYFITQRIFPVKYEFSRILKIALAALIILSGSFLWQPVWLSFVWKLSLLVLFGLIIYWLKFFDRTELARLRKFSSVRSVSQMPEDMSRDA